MLFFRFLMSVLACLGCSFFLQSHEFVMNSILTSTSRNLAGNIEFFHGTSEGSHPSQYPRHFTAILFPRLFD